MRTYLILKERAQRWNADAEIQALLRENHAYDGAAEFWRGGFSADKVEQVRSYPVDRVGLGKRNMGYERLDQLTLEVLLGVR
jgi:xylose isomerase